MEVSSPTWRPEGAQGATIGSLRGGLLLPAALAQGALGGQGYPQEAVQEANRSQSKSIQPPTFNGFEAKTDAEMEPV